MKRSFIRQLAEDAATHPRMQAAVMGGILRELPDIIEILLHERLGGDGGTLRGSKNPRVNRVERDQRIEAALSTGEQHRSIALRERVSVRHVERIKARSTRQVAP